MRHWWHLVKRFVLSMSRRPPDGDDVTWAETFLGDGERELWHRLGVADRRHSIMVARRFADAGELRTGEEMAGALLHDVGKLDSGLGALARVAATVVGPRTDRFRRYHDHERIGAELLREAGSSSATVELVAGRGRAADALRAADDI
jgi:hypothetical protein